MYIKKISCEWCGLIFDGDTNVPNHLRWCKLNPKHAEYVKTLAKNRENIVNYRNQFVKAKDNGTVVPPGTMTGKPGTMAGKTHSVKTKNQMSHSALASSHRRLVRSMRDYTKKDGSIVKLDSSWEEALARRLDEINVEWIRPAPIKWIDPVGIYHNYFPDFFLCNYNIYLDPKGPYAIKAQKDKIKCLTEQIKNLIIITTLTECKNFTP